MKSNTLTIIKKEFARFFGDRQMLFTTVLLPGLLIYLIYSFMGMGMKKMVTEGANELVTLCVENLPASMAPIVDGIPATMTTQQAVSQEDIEKLKDKNLNVVLVRFPKAFDEKVATYDPQSGMTKTNKCVTARLQFLSALADGMATDSDLPGCVMAGCGYSDYDPGPCNCGHCDDLGRFYDPDDPNICYVRYDLAANTSGRRRLVLAFWYPSESASQYEPKDRYKACPSARLAWLQGT